MLNLHLRQFLSDNHCRSWVYRSAAMIFGKWNPIGAMLSSLFFGLSQSLAVIGSQLPFPTKGVPAVYLQIAPYVLTILVLAAFFGKAVAPKADGINYIKSK